MTIQEINQLPQDSLKAELYKCCGSTNWVNKMIQLFPMEDLVELLEVAEQQWFTCTENDWKEAFAQHPEIGDIESLTTKFASTAEWAAGEQTTVSKASPELIRHLAAANMEYKNKFGYIFIVCATGKSADEMLSILQQRLPNEPAQEVKIAMEEQNKITLLRIQKLAS